MRSSRRCRAGLLLARAGGTLMILGGIGDLTLRALLQNHRELLGLGSSPVPETTEMLVLTLLHALGAALIACGVAILILLREAQRGGRRAPAVAAAVVALLAEGMNSVGMYRTGSPYFIAPLAFLLLVATGVALYVSAPRTDERATTTTGAATS